VIESKSAFHHSLKLPQTSQKEQLILNWCCIIFNPACFGDLFLDARCVWPHLLEWERNWLVNLGVHDEKCVFFLCVTAVQATPRKPKFVASCHASHSVQIG
jgi:hypothetical protein